MAGAQRARDLARRAPRSPAECFPIWQCPQPRGTARPEPPKLAVGVSQSSFFPTTTISAIDKAPPLSPSHPPWPPPCFLFLGSSNSRPVTHVWDALTLVSADLSPQVRPIVWMTWQRPPRCSTINRSDKVSSCHCANQRCCDMSKAPYCTECGSLSMQYVRRGKTPR